MASSRNFTWGDERGITMHENADTGKVVIELTPEQAMELFCISDNVRDGSIRHHKIVEHMMSEHVPTCEALAAGIRHVVGAISLRDGGKDVFDDDDNVLPPGVSELDDEVFLDMMRSMLGIPLEPEDEQLPPSVDVDEDDEYTW